MAVTMEGAARQGKPMTRAEVAEIHRLRTEEELSKPAIAARVGRGPTAVSRALQSSPADWPAVPLRSVPPSPAAGLSVRRAKAMVRRDLITGRVTLADVLSPVDPALADFSLAEVVRLQWSAAGRRAMPALEELGRYAVRDGVNLMMAAGRASVSSRAWVAEHGSKWARPRAVAS